MIVSCPTYPKSFLKSFLLLKSIVLSSIFIIPLVGFKKPQIISHSEVFPEPDFQQLLLFHFF